MTTTRFASTADVAHSVCTSEGAQSLPLVQNTKIVDFTLRTVIGLNCQNGNTLDINLGNGHVLSCSVKKAIGPTDV
ncbi:hypothetical protein [Comamonas testosteroni]|uniref:hypothetical protein n=1 Tax=Comamonas testosteroni TaxID=285 RepID=UPI0015FCA13B|nr:hypothetical protein [Comamonas testosteroni]